MDTHLKLDDELKSRIQHLAELRHCPTNLIMVEAIQDYVKRLENSEKINQQTTAAWTEYQQTGLHLTGDEVCDWLDSWGTEQESSIPQCHK